MCSEITRVWLTQVLQIYWRMRQGDCRSKSLAAPSSELRQYAKKKKKKRQRHFRGTEPTMKGRKAEARHDHVLREWTKNTSLSCIRTVCQPGQDYVTV